MASPYRENPRKTPEELRELVEILRADLRWSNEARRYAYEHWIRAEQRLDLWMPLGFVTLAAVVTLMAAWIVGWV